MRQLIIQIPDELPESFDEWLLKGSMNKIENELRKQLAYPQEDVAAIDVQVASLKAAMNIVEEKEKEEKGIVK